MFKLVLEKAEEPEIKLPTSNLILLSSVFFIKRDLKQGFFVLLYRELRDVQAHFRKGRGTRDQIANICWIMEKAREFQKKHLFLFY